MGDEQHSHCSLVRMSSIRSRTALPTVTSGQRFVGDEHARRGQQRRCEPATLRLTPGHFVGEGGEVTAFG